MSTRDLGLRHAEDREVFLKAREVEVVIMSKDENFRLLVEQRGAPPQVIWVTSGNMSNNHFKSLLSKTFAGAMALIERGESVVEFARREQE